MRMPPRALNYFEVAQFSVGQWHGVRTDMVPTTAPQNPIFVLVTSNYVSDEFCSSFAFAFSI
jgi:hypothetical protein